MSESAKAQHPLVKVVAEAKAILGANAEPTGPSKADTIAALNALFNDVPTEVMAGAL